MMTFKEYLIERTKVPKKEKEVPPMLRRQSGDGQPAPKSKHKPAFLHSKVDAFTGE